MTYSEILAVRTRKCTILPQGVFCVFRSVVLVISSLLDYLVVSINRRSLFVVNLECFSSISDRTSDFNSRKVGIELAQSMITLFDPTLDGMVLDNEK